LKKFEMDAGAAANVKNCHTLFRPEHPDPKQSEAAIHRFEDCIVQPGKPAIWILCHLLLTRSPVIIFPDFGLPLHENR
jgi:hypothetical protein